MNRRLYEARQNLLDARDAYKRALKKAARMNEAGGDETILDAMNSADIDVNDVWEACVEVNYIEDPCGPDGQFSLLVGYADPKCHIADDEIVDSKYLTRDINVFRKDMESYPFQRNPQAEQSVYGDIVMKDGRNYKCEFKGDRHVWTYYETLNPGEYDWFVFNEMTKEF